MRTQLLDARDAPDRAQHLVQDCGLCAAAVRAHQTLTPDRSPGNERLAVPLRHVSLGVLAAQAAALAAIRAAWATNPAARCLTMAA